MRLKNLLIVFIQNIKIIADFVLNIINIIKANYYFELEIY